jgi:hypothetical protein
MAAGLLDTDGRVIHPPPIVDVAGYRRSARLLAELAPVRLLTAHYDVIEGADVECFLAASVEFVDRAGAIVAAALADEPDIALRDLLSRADEELGPFTSMPNELAATLRSILQDQGHDPRPTGAAR